jgi:hypothetical protein
VFQVEARRLLLAEVLLVVVVVDLVESVAQLMQQVVVVQSNRPCLVPLIQITQLPLVLAAQP